ncbi:hypothetical protein [Tenacibaculum finnmarkense]|uniref:hypothetical protein n=1 Tax=Tenacibaculum finnmarkense TaxID=2781243 RepID=UPI000C36F111|nr:hypothetical protein [Tenacibaculum finnmarkense]MCD8440273.1 hypothetical protein [Tenacibaculum finnmarkense genomovar ulcerans]MCG8721103.1 hypothetical protein [Tenacibaculum finnmarkense]SOS54683.1 conserved hypothetical protein [Tenacibaculum finnmarkense]
MDSWNLRVFRNDLSIFIQLIKDYNIPGRYKDELDSVIEQINTKGIIDYKLKDLCLYVSGLKGSLPTGVNHYQIYLNIFLKYKDNFSQSVDPLYRYKFEINIHGYPNKSYTGKYFKSSWHLDQHTVSSSDKYTHPSYHFQFGGNKIKTLSSGDLLMLGTPRIPHPPMDIFLGFHFILANYYDNTKHSFVKELLNDPVYEEILKRAQERLWTPYFKAFEITNTHQDFTMSNIFPLYIN